MRQLVAGWLPVLLIACSLPAMLAPTCIDDGSSAGGGDPGIKGTEAALQPPTPTPIPPVEGACPGDIEAALCDAVENTVQGLPESAPLAPLAAICPPADAWLLALEPVCSKELAGEPVGGYASGGRQYAFVDETEIRESLAAIAEAGPRITGIACSRASEDEPLDCSDVIAVLLEASSTGPMLLFLSVGTDGVALSGARSTVMPELINGGWVSTAHAGLEEHLPEQMWLIPWTP